MEPKSIDRIYWDAAQIASPDEREAYLQRVCAEDVKLRCKVDQLLAARSKAENFLESPAPALVATVDEALSERPGTIIGSYKLLEQIGEGGFGIVFMAEQHQPVRRKVALKVLKPGMDTRQVIARFEAEQQALALMDHPNIAHVFDGGETASGRPYFVMELVRGIPITGFCDQSHLPVRQRMELFVTVCQAIQHAHQKGIIHRDIKPTNVLVTLHDGMPVAKVIDFGVAKALGQQLTDKTLFTNFAQIIGTPLYMSPEQAQMSGLDVDTRSDIYALGVLLYELLTGTTPFDRERLKTMGYDEIRRIIRDEEPAKPSTRISTLGQVAATVSANRGSDAKRLSQLFRGELDWIVLKALEKDRNRRYETASAFAADVHRYLNDETVQACPPSAWYRFSKFARRNKAPVLATSLILLCLIGGIIGTSWAMLWAIEAENATRAEVIEKDKATKEAQDQAAIATSISASLQQLLGSLDPDAAKGPDYTARQLLDDYAANLEEKLAEQPQAAADLHAIIGRGYACVGQRDKARKHLGRALVLRRSVFGDNHEKYADILVDYARPDASDPSERPERDADLRQALAIYRARGVGGKPVIRALWTLQWSLVEQAFAGAADKWDQIEPVVNEALAEAAKSPDVGDPKIASILRGLVGAKIARSNYAEAEKIARQALAMHLKLNRPEDLETAWGYYVLGDALRAEHKFAEAIQAEIQALTIMRKALPAEHRSIAMAMTAVIRTLDMAEESHALADLFSADAQLGEVEPVFREVLTTTKQAKLNNDGPVLVAIEGLARFSEFHLDLCQKLASAGKTKEAEEFRQKAIRQLENLQTQFARNPGLLEAVTPDLSRARNRLAWYLATAEVSAHRDPARAIELAKKAVEPNPQFGGYRKTLGIARYRAGDWKQAISDLEKSSSLEKGGNSFDWFFLAMAHWKLGNKHEARQWYDKAVEWMEKNSPKSEELPRFRAEAADLLGVKEKK